MIRDGLPIWFFWEGATDEPQPLKSASSVEAFAFRPPPPIRPVHVGFVSTDRDSLTIPHQALCG
jgi:hypothetical protein